MNFFAYSVRNIACAPLEGPRYNLVLEQKVSSVSKPGLILRLQNIVLEETFFFILYLFLITIIGFVDNFLDPEDFHIPCELFLIFLAYSGRNNDCV